MVVGLFHLWRVWLGMVEACISPVLCSQLPDLNDAAYFPMPAGEESLHLGTFQSYPTRFGGVYLPLRPPKFLFLCKQIDLCTILYP